MDVGSSQVLGTGHISKGLKECGKCDSRWFLEYAVTADWDLCNKVCVVSQRRLNRDGE